MLDLVMVKHLLPLIFLIGLSYSQGGGYALDFDGYNDFVEVSHNSAFSLSSVITVQAWVLPHAAEDNKHIVSKGTHVNYTTREYSIQGPWANNKWLGAISIDGDGEYTVSSSNNATLNKWSHVALTYDGSTIKLYINGSLEASNSQSGSINTTTNLLYIGDHVHNSSDYYFDGRVDDVAIWNVALSQSQIQGYMHILLVGNESNLALLYKMTDGSGTSLNDNSPTAENGSLNNMEDGDWVTSYAPIADLNSSYKTSVEAIWSMSGTSASDASDGLTMTVSSALSTGNFAVFGNNNTSGTSTSDIGSVGSTNRTGRIWQVDESGTVAGTITIDISDATGNSGGTGTASNFRLLYRSSTSGDFSSAATGASISGDAVSFTSVSLADGYYALGTQSDASLPVELTSFEVLGTRDNGITLHWITESEINNLGFILDRRTPTIDWIEIASFVTDTELQGQGSVSHQTVYTYTDNTVTDDETYDYRIADVDYDGNKEYHSLQLMGISPASIPITYVLRQNYPNPFNPITTLSYDLPEDAMVNITIYDMMGRIVSNLVSSWQAAGYKSIQWNATNNLGEPVTAGLYLYTIQAGDFRQTRKMVLLK
jgi:hypothetical protein